MNPAYMGQMGGQENRAAGRVSPEDVLPGPEGIAFPCHASSKPLQVPHDPSPCEDLDRQDQEQENRPSRAQQRERQGPVLFLVSGPVFVPAVLQGTGREGGQRRRDGGLFRKSFSPRLHQNRHLGLPKEPQHIFAPDGPGDALADGQIPLTQGFRHVDPDHPSPLVEQRPPGIPRIYRRIGLQKGHPIPPDDPA